MWDIRGSADQLPVAPQGRREELPEGSTSVKGPGGVDPREIGGGREPGGVDPREIGGGRERVLEETKGFVKSLLLNPWSAEKMRELYD